MHPPLIPDLHPKCGEAMEALMRCHREHNIAKWWGACNDPKFALTRCLAEEKAELRADRLARAKEQYRAKRREELQRLGQAEQRDEQDAPAPAASTSAALATYSTAPFTPWRCAPTFCEQRVAEASGDRACSWQHAAAERLQAGQPAAKTNRFIACDTSKNLPGSYYHVRLPETQVLHMSFEEWQQRLAAWTATKLLLQATVCTWRLRALRDAPGSDVTASVTPKPAVWPGLERIFQPLATSAAADTAHAGTARSARQQQGVATGAVHSWFARGSPAPAGGAADGAGSGGGVSDLASRLIDWQLLGRLTALGAWTSEGTLHLECGGDEALLPAQYATHDRVVCQVSGARRVLLVPPEAAFPAACPYPVAHPYDTYSCIDWEEPELEFWPHAAKIRGQLVDLASGDALYVPAYWFAHTQLIKSAEGGPSAALVVGLRPGAARILPPPALRVQASRMVETWVAAEVRPANVRRWLQLLAGHREAEQADPETLQGYKRVVMCQEVRDVLALALAAGTPEAPHWDEGAVGGVGAGGWWGGEALRARVRELLETMCEGRLVRTAWLNQNAMGPSYLLTPPEVYEVEEDEEAARYPQLLRHRLLSQRADWQAHARRVQLKAEAAPALPAQAIG